MLTYISDLFKNLGTSAIIANYLSVIVAIFGILAISYCVHLLHRIFFLFFPYFKTINTSKSHWIKFAKQHSIFRKLYFLGHLLFISLLVNLITPEESFSAIWLIKVIHTIFVLCIIGAVTSLVSSLLNVVNEVYKISFEFARQRPIKSYLDSLKIIIWIIAILITISALTNQSPITMLAGLGILGTGITLIFKDSILGFISSIQVSAYDIVRIGDWIQIKKYDIDGDVIDISLNTVKVQNFDKTIATIPTYELIATGVINWRGMQESGGRRIKRAVNINTDTIKLCDAALLKKLSKMNHLNAHISKQTKKMPSADKNIFEHDKILTNIGLYREYIKSYLNARGDILTHHFTFLVRELQPTETGLPIELYVFTKTTNWVKYEEIQADIFDHIISVLPYFELKLFQNISSATLRKELSN